jgi:hypothetical protein
MESYKGPQTPLTIALHGDFFSAIIMERNEGPQTTLTIDCMEDSNQPL